MSPKASTDLTTFLLTEIKKRPGMYLMDKDLISLKKFLYGYRFGFNNSKSARKDRFLEFFEDWFHKTTNTPYSTMWYVHILEECNGSQEKALQRFWEYLEKFSEQVKELL